MFGSMKRLVLASAAVAVGGGMIAMGAGADKKAEIGKPAPDFTLTDYQGKEHTLSSYTAQGNVVVLEWFSHECPFVKKHYRDDTQTMNNLVTSWEGKPVVWLRVNSAATTNPAGNTEAVKAGIEDFKITGPVLVDSDGKVGKTYGAKRTPEMYVIDASGVLVYHGAIDNDRTAKGAGETNYVANAVAAVLAGKPVEVATTEAYGCGVKYAD